MIDRFDARAMLDIYTKYERPHVPSSSSLSSSSSPSSILAHTTSSSLLARRLSLSREEKGLEVLLNFERYRSLLNAESKGMFNLTQPG
jgi:hypothetical protein